MPRTNARESEFGMQGEHIRGTRNLKSILHTRSYIRGEQKIESSLICTRMHPGIAVEDQRNLSTEGFNINSSSHIRVSIPSSHIQWLIA